jgi:hypothetical protein
MTEDGTSTVMTREGASIVMTEVNIIRRESINDPNSQHNVGKYNTWQVDSIFLRGRTLIGLVWSDGVEHHFQQYYS